MIILCLVIKIPCLIFRVLEMGKIQELKNNYGENYFLLSPYLEYSIYLPNKDSKSRVFDKFIIIKSINNFKFYKVVLSLTAYSDLEDIKYQELITLYELDEIPIIHHILNIPFRTPLPEDNHAYPKYNSIKLQINEAFDDKGTVINTGNKYYSTLRYNQEGILSIEETSEI